MSALRAAAGGKRSIIVAIVMTALAPLLAYAAVREAVVSQPGGAGDPSAALPPGSLLPQIKAIMRTARRPDQKLPKGAEEVARLAAVQHPLAYEPYFIVARAEEQRGRYDRATVLMEEARRRRPNATSTRVALLGYYSLADAYQKAIDEADMAMRINGRSMALILPAFAKLVALDPKARRAIAVALAKNPPWRDAFLDAAAVAKMKPADATALVADIRRLRPRATPGAEEAFLVRSLFDAGQYREASALWRSYSPRPRADGEVIVDGKFEGQPSMRPFAWSLAAGENGAAEITKASPQSRAALEVDYFGSAAIVLADQHLVADPGRYRLSTLVAGSSSAQDVRISWRVTCLPGGALLGEIQLQPLTEQPTRREVPVTIPGSGCSGQTLSLLGQPGEISRTLSAEIAEVSLLPAGPRATKR